jgi:hypothetical protein
MATVDPSEVLTPLDKRGIRIFKWAGVVAADTCTPVVCGQYSDCTVYMYGTFGGNMSLEGSPDPAGTTYVVLTDPQGNAISGKSAAFVEQILEGAYKIRPVAAAGVTLVDVFLVCKSTR